MKRIALMAVIGLAALAQDPEVKHLAVAPLSGTSSGKVSVSARSIERGAEYPSVIRLKGNVEIRTPQCFVKGPGTETVCYGDTVVRADEAEYREDTGAIEARGNVTVLPLISRRY